MKQVLTLLIALALAGYYANGQTYIYESQTGPQPFLSGMRYAETILKSGENDIDQQLSGWQTLPFAWEFYGQEVSGYYVSDNGYISFDQSATESIAANTAIPNAGAPNNAIYAFWDDLFLGATTENLTNEVVRFTWGEAPGRQHVILWITAAAAGYPAASYNALSFAIVLHEGGDFDIVYLSGAWLSPMRATVGAENAAGDKGFMLPESPARNFPSLRPTSSDDICYKFTYWDRAYDARLLEATSPKIHTVGSDMNVSAVVQNLGREAISSLDMHYRVNGGATHSTSLSGLALASGTQAELSHTIPWTPAQAGEMYDIDIWIDNLNGGEPDEYIDNNALATTVFTNLGISGNKRPLVEEFTGAWCGWCADGALQVQRILEEYPEAVVASIHAGQPDRMVTAAGSALASAYGAAFPQAMVDRRHFDGEEGVPVSRTDDAWLIRTGERMAAYTPVNVSIDKNYQPANREISVSVQLDFVDYAYPDDMRLNVYILEDKVVGEGEGYDQVNYISGMQGFEDHPLYNEPDVIKEFVHRHVLRAVPTGTWGEAIAGPYTLAKVLTRQYTYTLPESYNENEISIIAFITFRDSEDLSKGEVLNAREVHLLNSNTDVEEPHISEQVAMPLPNPARTQTALNLDVQQGGIVQIELYNTLAEQVLRLQKEVAAGPQQVEIPLNGLSPGLYLIRVAYGDAIHWRKLMVAH